VRERKARQPGEELRLVADQIYSKYTNVANDRVTISQPSTPLQQPGLIPSPGDNNIYFISLVHVTYKFTVYESMIMRCKEMRDPSPDTVKRMRARSKGEDVSWVMISFPVLLYSIYSI
jgi:hypothetical protein